MPKVALPTLLPNTIKAAWLGQDGAQVTGLGDVHVALSSLPSGRVPVAAVLSDSVRRTWVFKQDDRVKLETEYGALPLAVRGGRVRVRRTFISAPTVTSRGPR